MATADITPMECGYCLRKDSALVDPKTLPCSHVHCLECLTAFFKRNHVVRCPKCSNVYDVTLDSLPTASPVGDDSPSCDVCTDKGVRDQPAVIYCTTCSRKFCAKHQESHDDIFGAHTKIEISEYRTQANKLKVRTCIEHGVPLALGCKTCLTVACVQCVPECGTCTNGSPHVLALLDDLVMEVIKEINESKVEVIDKEDKLYRLFKKTSEIIADFEAETEELMQKIHQRRDEQTKAITKKYQSLEKKLVDLRAQRKAAMTQFMEEDVGRKLSDLDGHRLRMETWVKHGHQVDVIMGFGEKKNRIRKLIDDILPKFKTEMTVYMSNKEESRDIELEVNGLHIPRSLTLKSNNQVSACPVSVSHSLDNTYIALNNNTVCRLDGNYQLTNPFMTFGHYVEGVVAYKNRVYTLVYGVPHTIHVHDLSGQFITSWDHTDTSSCHINIFTIINDQIIIADRRNKTLTLYSLDGQTLRCTTCSRIGNSIVAICAAGADSVIVSSYDSNQVFRVSISTGEVSWVCRDVSQPGGIACYGEGWVLVASLDNDNIYILDANTGEFQSEVTTNDTGNSCMMDLHISGNSLIVPGYNQKEILYYQMN